MKGRILAVDNIPRSRKEALAAGLPKFIPFKPCRRGHIGERHVVKGCLICNREKKQRQHAARILTGDWLDTLERAITEQRESSLQGSMVRAGVWLSHVDHIEPRKLALFIAHVITKPRPENKPPSLLTVAQDIGRLLEVKPHEKAEAVGGMLLGAAEECGFIKELTPQERVQGRMPSREIHLSIEAQLQRESIEHGLAQTDIPESRPVFDAPAPVINISGNPNDHAKAPRPIPEDQVVAALAPIQATAWRVNQFIYRKLRALAPVVSFDLTEGKHTASVAALEQAGYVGERGFYYPCRFDWRGRIYQLGGRLQYTSGADAARALLEFADGEALTPDGYTYLALHVATCYGSKESLTDRVVWTHKNTPQILEAAADPVACPFWRDAKEPYQFLAACDAWRKAQTPGAVIHLPVAADATSSLLQHYALLLRDVDLGEKVNLTARQLSEQPVDFYGGLVESANLDRDAVKQGAWNFYGQTKNSLARTLLAEGYAADWPGALAAAKVVRDGLRKNARGAMKLLKRLRAVARQMSPAKATKPRKATAKRRASPGRLARAEGSPIAWTLPDHFRVAQANYEAKTKMTDVWLMGWAVVNGKRVPKPWQLQARRRVLTDTLSAMDQINGLPANVIHSLDACLLRAIVREAAKVSRWGVAHDCIAVHPNDGAALRRAARKAVRWLYGPDVLGELWRQWGPQAGARVKHARELPASMGAGWYTFS